MEGVSWRAVGTTLTAVVIAAMSGCSATAENPPQGIETSDPAATFAPMIAVHPRERWLPIAADEFIAGSTLRWRDGDCGDDAIAASAGAGATGVPRLNPARLGLARRPYQHRPGRPPDCATGRLFATSGYTRPNDPLRANDIPRDEGFYLDLDDSRRVATASKRIVPTYFERHRTTRPEERSLRITYWMLFRMHQPPGPPALTESAGHEGDWERVSVLLRVVAPDRYVPLSVRYHDEDARARYADNTRDVPWRSVRRVARSGRTRTHPVALAARGSHTLYPKPVRARVVTHGITTGRRKLYDNALACPKCVAWRTWRDLRSATKEPWYGYGGGWGDSLGARTAAAGLGPSGWNDIEPFQLS
jgi:hypothetical protein